MCPIVKPSMTESPTVFSGRIGLMYTCRTEESMFAERLDCNRRAKAFCYCQMLIVHRLISPEQSCNYSWVYPIVQPCHFPLIIVESPSAENLSNSLTLSTNLLYSLNSSPTSLILSSSTLHSINFFFSDGSNSALLSPNETPDVTADVDAGAVTGIKFS